MNKIENILCQCVKNRSVPTPENHKGAGGISDGGQGVVKPFTHITLNIPLSARALTDAVTPPSF